jgi:hypothetical protein
MTTSLLVVRSSKDRGGISRMRSGARTKRNAGASRFCIVPAPQPGLAGPAPVENAGQSIKSCYIPAAALQSASNPHRICGRSADTRFDSLAILA